MADVTVYIVVDMLVVKFEKNDCVMGVTGAFTLSVSQESWQGVY